MNARFKNFRENYFLFFFFESSKTCPLNKALLVFIIIILGATMQSVCRFSSSFYSSSPLANTSHMQLNNDKSKLKKRQREEDSEWEDDESTKKNEKEKQLNKWASTPTPRSSSFFVPTPDLSKQSSFPSFTSTSTSSSTPSRSSRWDVTPVGASFPTPIHSHSSYLSLSSPFVDDQQSKWSDEDLDDILPVAGYSLLLPPSSYVPLRTPARRSLSSTPSPLLSPSFFIQEDNNQRQNQHLLTSLPPDLPILTQEDASFLSSHLVTNPETLNSEEQKEQQVMLLLLKIKNGNPTMRKTALRTITNKAIHFGPGPIFNTILPLFLSSSLSDQERHLLVKVINRVLFKLDDLVRPYTHKIMVVMEPLLIDEDYFTRAEGREIISNLTKAVGLATMIVTIRPDIDNTEEFVRNVTARSLSVVASALGISPLIPFLTAVCRSKKSWQARHTGIKTVQQIAILMGCAILPHLSALVGMIEGSLVDKAETPKVKTITSLALAALAEAAAPYGVESFATVIPLLLSGVRQLRGKILAAYIKALGFIIPLMEDSHASYHARELMLVLVRQFNTNEPEMKGIILKVVRQVLSTEGVDANFVRERVLPPFFEHLWDRRTSMDKRNHKQLVETVAAIANKVGGADIISQVVLNLKDESEDYRALAVEVVEQIAANLGTSDVDTRLEVVLVDGLLYAFQENNSDKAILKRFGAIINSLGKRAKPYIPQICGIIKFRMNNKSSWIRQQAADLVTQLASVAVNCGEEKLLARIGEILYENLGEEYPEVLASIIGAIKSIVNVIGMHHMSPPVKDLLPRLVPILQNRHERVQENCIDLVGRIADRGSEYVSAREWMRVCFQLLEMIRANKLGIRRAAVNTFGYIARAIGPQDVMSLLMNNLKVKERQERVCTCVAMAIVAETCQPFTVIPSLLNEYQTPELNVQNGVLKALSFMFEYVGEMAKDCI